MVLLSIIVSVYNKKDYLNKCLSSLIEDDIGFQYEVILVDDGSTDGSGDICDEYAAKYPVISVIHTLNHGVSSARNTGINNARGKWVTLVDADDYLEDNAINIMATILENHGNKNDIIYFDGFGDKNGKLIKNECYMEEGIDYSQPDEKEKLLRSAISIGNIPKGYNTVFSTGGVCCKLIRKSFLDQKALLYHEGVLFAEDTLFSVNAIVYAKGIRYAPEFLYHYVLNADSVTNRYRQGLSKEMRTFFDEMLQVSEEHKEFDLNSAIMLRGFIEAQRCLRNEFYNPLNDDTNKNKKTKADEFLLQEPFYTAISYYYQNGSPTKKIIAFLLKKRKYRLYVMIYRICKLYKV